MARIVARSRADVLPAARPRSTSVQGLHCAKMALDNSSKAIKFGDDPSGLIDSRDLLLGVIQNISKPYGNAMATYCGRRRERASNQPV